MAVSSIQPIPWDYQFVCIYSAKGSQPLSANIARGRLKTTEQHTYIILKDFYLKNIYIYKKIDNQAVNFQGFLPFYFFIFFVATEGKRTI